MMPWTNSWSIGLTASEQAFLHLRHPLLILIILMYILANCLNHYQIHNFPCTIIHCLVGMVKELYQIQIHIYTSKTKTSYIKTHLEDLVEKETER